jgi:hypothetical protein
MLPILRSDSPPCAEERQKLILAYLGAIENSRKGSDSVKYIYSLEWLLETEQKRKPASQR